MRLVTILIFGIFILLNGCKSKSEFQVVIESNIINADTLFIRDVVTGLVAAKIPLAHINEEHNFTIKEPILGEIAVKNLDETYLTLLRPGVKKVISIDSTSLKTKYSIPDSLANYFWTSTNQMFTLYDEVIFAQDNPERVIMIFDSLIQKRAGHLNEFKAELTAEEFNLLEYQNQARAYSFLMFYGRIVKGFSPRSDFFSFVSKIDNENIYTKSLPDNLLYKYEIQFLNEMDSIPDIKSFLKFIEQQTTNRDLQDYLKAIYMKSVIERPSYWRKHETLFTTLTIKDAFLRERDNKYSHLIQKASDSFYASQRGMEGFDFTAYKLDGTELKLSDLKGKVVLIDAWATWCGPCVEHRPGMLEIAKKFHGNPNIAVLMISVDSSPERWNKYVNKTNPENYGVELIVPDGMDLEFGEKYLIKSIPKYILIDSQGVIIDSNLPEPSVRMEEMVLREIEKM